MINEKLIRASEARKAILDADPKLAYCIDNIKGVDAVEVIHGRWVGSTAGNGYIGLPRCSICGHISFAASNYCQDCGAKMDGGNEDGN